MEFKLKVTTIVKINGYCNIFKHNKFIECENLIQKLE